MTLFRLVVAVALIVAGVALMGPWASPRDVVVPATAIPTASERPTPRTTPTPTPSAAPPSTFTLTVSDADLTKAAAASFPQTVNGVTVRDPEVRISPSGVRLTATARVFFGTTQFVMTGTPYVSAGRIGVRVDSATLGGLALPDSVRASIATSVETAIANLVPPSVSVRTISLASGTMTIDGVVSR